MTSPKFVDPGDWDVEALIDAIGALGDSRRRAALAVLAHHLTVEIRLALDEPASGSAINRLRLLNEFLHHLTERLNPEDRRSAADDAALLEAFVADAGATGLEKSLKRSLTIAVRHTAAGTKRPIPAI